MFSQLECISNMITQAICPGKPFDHIIDEKHSVEPVVPQKSFLKSLNKISTMLLNLKYKQHLLAQLEFRNKIEVTKRIPPTEIIETSSPPGSTRIQCILCRCNFQQKTIQSNSNSQNGPKISGLSAS